MKLQGERILLGVSGGIAAYKSAEFCRLLTKAGAEVQVVMTRGAEAFITPLTFQALTNRATRTALLDETAEQGMGHIELARWATRIVLAPASANLLARVATGMADDLLTTVILASRAPLAIAPAMNQGMWANPAVQANCVTVDQLYSPLWLGPDAGEQACGDVGAGRLMEPETMVDALVKEQTGTVTAEWQGRRVVITAGPTREAIDPVRYLSNNSSGRMGFALAAAAARAGAEVILIAGPVNLPTPQGVKRIDVQSAQDMWAAAREQAPGADLFIGAAAVADYRVTEVHAQKRKKTTAGEDWTLTLTENPDIIHGVAAMSHDRPQQVVGFAAETDNVVDYARDKLARKQLDWIVANDVSRADIGFNSDQNEVTVFGRDGSSHAMSLQSKHALGAALLALFAKGIRT